MRQGNKIRPVDDFSQYLINSSITCHDKIDLEGIDNICAVARFFVGAPQGDGKFFLPFLDGFLKAVWRPPGKEVNTATSWEVGETPS